MKTQPDVSPEIKEFTDLWGQMQKSFFADQIKLEIHLRDRGFNPTKEPYNWKKNPAKLNTNEMILRLIGFIVIRQAYQKHNLSFWRQPQNNIYGIN